MKKQIVESLGTFRLFLVELGRRLAYAGAMFRMRFIQLAVNTHVALPDDFVFDEAKAASRGRKAPDGKHYSAAYELGWDALPLAIKREIRKFDSVIRLYFGGDYLIHTANVWRNIGIPDQYRELDIYSQVWHYDHVVDYRNIQLFVLLSDTTEHHGPFEYVGNASQTQPNGDVVARNGAELPDAQVVRLIGKRGDGLLFSTGSTPHRAGIPLQGNHRDMFSIAFFPVYTGLGASAQMLFAQMESA